MERKYHLSKETIDYCGRKLYRIIADKDFSDVKKGDKGGWIEKEDNLSQTNNAWVYGNMVQISQRQSLHTLPTHHPNPSQNKMTTTQILKQTELIEQQYIDQY